MRTNLEMDSSAIQVMLVEDDEDDYIITSDFLSEIEGKQFTVKWFKNYDSALKVIGDNQYDVILVDYQLGQHTGLDFLQAALSKGCKVPIILLTGQGDREIDTKAMKAGASDYLVKGRIDPQLLERSIRYAIERKQVENELRQSQERFRQLAQRQELLNRLASQIRKSLDFNIILKTTADEICKLLQIQRCRFLWYRTDIEPFYFESIHEAGVAFVYPSNPDHLQGITILEKTALQLNILRIECILTDPHLDEGSRDLLTNLGLTSLLAVPIKTRSEAVGIVLCEHFGEPRLWSKHEMELLQAVADQLIIAIDQAELYHQSRFAAATAQAQAQQLESAFAQLQKTQSQLIQTEKMSSLGQLVAGVAHEINNPISFIYGNLEYVSSATQDLLELLRLYQQRYLAPDPVISAKAKVMDLDFLMTDLPKSVNSMQVGAERIRQIVLSLRNFSRLEEAEMKPVDIHEGINNTLLILQHRLQENAEHPRIEVVKQYDQLPRVECYAGQLNQVFMNILSNAIDALEELKVKGSTPANLQPVTPCIWIRTEVREGKQVVIQIADNGSGMSEAVQKRLFDPFFTTKPPGKGTGLGLSISYQIVVDKHGGQLRCHSAVGQGSEFIIELPLSQDKTCITQLRNECSILPSADEH